MEFITYIAKSAGILTLFYLVYIFVLRKDTFFTANRTFLLVGIASALLLPFVTFTTVTLVETPVFVPTVAIEELNPIQIVQTTPVKEAIDIWQILVTIYLIGLGIMAARFGIQLASLFNLLRKHPSRRANGFRFIEMNDSIAPFSFFNYIIFNPETHEQQELEMILQHEKVHAAQWHSIDVLLSNIMRALQWANPISWLYKKSIEANLEFLADNQTVSNIPSKTEYQLALLKASSSLPVPALTNNFYHSFIKKRIIMLNKSNSKKYNQLKLMLVLPALALFLWSFNTEDVIEYTTSSPEISLKENNSLATLNSVMSFSAKTTNAELDALEIYFMENHPESLVKIAERKRDASGSLINFSFQTKFSGNDRFYTRFDRGTGAPFQTVYTIEPQENGVLLVSEIGKDGVQFKITEDNLQLIATENKGLNLASKSVTKKQAKAKEPILGENPLYIINGKEYRKNQLPKDKTIALEGTAEILNKKEGEAKYGTKGKDGVMVLNGVSTFTKVEKKSSETKVSKLKPEVNSTVKEIRINITKNTTKEQLDGFKTELKRDHGIDFNYKNVAYNKKGEMTAISISYEGKGNKGTYTVMSDDGEPISDFYFYMDTEKGASGFGSKESELRKEKRVALLEKRNELRGNAMETRKEALKMRTENLSEVRSELAETRKELRQSQSKLRQEVAEMRKINGEVAETSNRLHTTIKSTASEKIVITKNTTDAQLKQMKTQLSGKGIDFNYKRVKRNSNGEIIGIKATFDNGKGSKVSKTIQTDGDDAIEMIVVEM
ncbi:M56 family metallopeptidase [Rasiella sp. SM2506]|uniref:M56 family metallopeptidase n=1 Tax=Rasiella sp. SM2506 TaxID=3423914 RepID=UPI003D7ABA9D